MAEIHTVRREFDPKSLIWPLIILLVVAGTIWGIINYIGNRREAVDPTIDITSPVDGENYDTNQVTVQGKASTDDVNITVNGKEAEVQKDGGFSAQVPLAEGSNVIAITAESKSGKIAEKKITVFKKAAPVAQVPTNPSAGPDLSNSGPETLWIPEASLLALSAAGYYGTKKRLRQTIKKS